MKEYNKPFADICIPALLYFIVGLTAIGFDMTHFAKIRDKTWDQFVAISVKVVVIFAVTAVLQLLCQNGHWITASAIAAVTSLYLFFMIHKTLQEDSALTPYRTVLQERTQRPPLPDITKPVSWSPAAMPDVQYQWKRIQPPAFLIGVDGSKEAQPNQQPNAITEQHIAFKKHSY